jgi:hypothetical protein
VVFLSSVSAKRSAGTRCFVSASSLIRRSHQYLCRP